MAKKKREAWRLEDTASGPQGVFKVSTIRTYMGGAPNEQSFGSPFGTKDYAKETPWPYEVMAFGAGNRKAQYHRPLTSQDQAETAHKAVIAMIEAGTLPLGHGVREPFGVPTTTPAEWRELAATL